MLMMMILHKFQKRSQKIYKFIRVTIAVVALPFLLHLTTINHEICWPRSGVLIILKKIFPSLLNATPD